MEKQLIFLNFVLDFTNTGLVVVQRFLRLQHCTNTIPLTYYFLVLQPNSTIKIHALAFRVALKNVKCECEYEVNQDKSLSMVL